MEDVFVRLPAASPDAYLRYLEWWREVERFLESRPGDLERGAGGFARIGPVARLVPAQAVEIESEATTALREGRSEIAPMVSGQLVLWRVALAQAERLDRWLDERAEAGEAVPRLDPDLVSLREDLLAEVRRQLEAVPAALRVTPGDEPGHLRIEGELDLSTVEPLAEGLEVELDARSHLTLDLSGVTFMDSNGIRLLLRLARSAEERGLAPVVLVEPSPSVQHILQIALPGGIPGVEIRSEGSAGRSPRPLLFFCL